jgi:hypothetical protein
MLAGPVHLYKCRYMCMQNAKYTILDRQRGLPHREACPVLSCPVLFCPPCPHWHASCCDPGISLPNTPTAADAAAAAAASDPAAAAVSAEEAELAAKQAEAARKEKILAAALAQEDAGGVWSFGNQYPVRPSTQPSRFSAVLKGFPRPILRNTSSRTPR